MGEDLTAGRQAGIVAFGAYVPQLRLRRAAMAAANSWANPGLKGQGKGERAVASWDEDVVTMAVEASRDALTAIERDAVGGLILASTTAPFADRLNAGIVSGALGLAEDALALDVAGSMRAGASATIAGLALAQASGKPVIVVAAERRRAKPGSGQEFNNGDAASALIVGFDRVLARVLAKHSVTRDFVDHFRAAGNPHDYGWEERWVREEGYQKLAPLAAGAALAAAGLTGADVTTLIVPSPLARIEAMVAKACKVPDAAVTDGLAATLGYAGAAHGALLLAKALETAQPGDRILIVTFGNGCDALLLEVTDEIANFAPKRGVSGWLAAGNATDDYTRYLSYNGEIDLEWGPRAEFGNKFALTMEYRFARDMLAFVGGRDRQTGVVQFPKTPASVAPGASGIAEWEDVPLAEESAKVVAATADWLTYHPSPPLYFGLVQFENGARVAMEFVDVASGSVSVGDDVEMVFRIKEIDRVRDYRHYFWKATPVPATAAPELAEAAE
jgi:hydroxymethylglutaryl-CoA synthase